jgi:hypothetical protein
MVLLLQMLSSRDRLVAKTGPLAVLAYMSAGELTVARKLPIIVNITVCTFMIIMMMMMISYNDDDDLLLYVRLICYYRYTVMVVMIPLVLLCNDYCDMMKSYNDSDGDDVYYNMYD